MRRRSRFGNRTDAGEALAAEVTRLLGPTPTGLVLALPRGGVPVAVPVAHALGAELDLLVVRKIGAPGHRELAIGAVASGGLVVTNGDVIAELGLRSEDLAGPTALAREELAGRERRLRGDRARPPLAGRPIVIVDDGLATGASMRAAIQAVRTAGPGRLTVAVPVGPPDTCAALAALADDVVCLWQPVGFSAVGEWYVDFGETTDDEVLQLLAGR
ncbi:MAG: phosphoribosyltransferase family protein [Ilumatobacteraceae bacterium]